MNPISGALAGILEAFDGARDIVGEEQMFNQLCDLTDPSKETLNEFADYFRKEGNLTPKIIFKIIDEISLNEETKAILGKRLTLIWLKYKSYEVLDIQKSPDAGKREKVSAAIDKFDFGSPASTIEQFIKVCFQAIGVDVSEEEMPDFKQALIEGKKEEIQGLFAKEGPPPPPIEYNPDKSIEEQLVDFIIDYKYFPDNSVEKVLQREQIIAFINKYPEAKELPCMKQIPELKNQTSNIKKLQEAYLNEFGVLNTEVSKIFKKFASEEGSKEIYENICALKSKIFAINILQLERLIKKTNDAKKLIENKDVIFILGTTGSGKSTNILKFLGYTLKAATFKNLPTLIPVQQLHKDHSSFYTSPQAKSCTRYINATPIPDKMYKIGTASNKKTLVICDSPGFGDSAGVEVDIANGVGMINALHGARSVRVVILLAHDALTSNRMQGAIKIGQIISSLFHQISQVVDSLAIYFNKVPKKDVASVPNFIQSKIDHLTQAEKANEKLVAFLMLLHQQSEKEDHFIYPLESNYQNLFGGLTKMPSIQKVKESFRYEFTDSTKNEINNFITSEKTKIKDYINNEKFGSARFHFKMLEKLKNILFVNEKIQESYTQIAKFVQKESLKQFKNFEEYLIQICKGEDSDKLSVNLNASRRKVTLFQQNFNDFDQVTPASKEEINKTIGQYKQRLLSEFKVIGSLNSNKIFNAVKIFSRELAPQLEKNVVDAMNKQFNHIYKEVDNYVDEKRYLQLGQLIKTLKSTALFISYISKDHISQKQMEELKSKLTSHINSFFEYFNENLLKQSIPLTIRVVKTTNQNLRYIQQIEALKFIDDSASIVKKMNQCTKAIISKCKSNIRQLDSLDLTIQSEEKSAIIDGNYLKNLSTKKKQIQLLMTISNVGQVLTQDYEYTKENIGRRLHDNVQILNNCISALRSNKNEEIQRDISIIKKASQIVLKCSQIVEQADNSKRIAESISIEFLNYLSSERQIIRNIQVRLNQINAQSIQKIERQYKKNETYSKMASIDPQIESAVKDLKEEFNKTLTNPFTEFKDRQISYLKNKGHYKYLTFSLERFEKFCFYSLQIEQIVNRTDYEGISITQKQIQSNLLEYFNIMKQQADKFNQMETIGQQPQYLRDLIKTLISISAKPYTCIYMSRKLDFEVLTEIDNIKNHLDAIKSLIDNKYSHYYESHNRIQELTNLVKVCRFYSNIEDTLKIKEQNMRFQFRELEKTINQCYFDNLKSDEDQAKNLIQGCQPTKMSWSSIKAIYDSFYQLKTPDGKRKRAIITSQLGKIESNILQSLMRFNGQISNNPDLIIVNKQKMNDFLDLFREAIQIQKNLNLVYVQEDKNLIQIKDRHLKDVGSNMIDAFKTQFDSVKKQLTDYNVTNIKQKINNFGTLENIVHSVFLQEDREKYEENESTIQNFKSFIEAKKKLLNEEIKKHDFIDTLQRKGSNQGKVTKLKNLLQSLQKGISSQIDSKYVHYGESFIIDSGFKKYYNNFIHPKDQSNIDILKHLVGNVKLYFNQLYIDFKEKSNVSADQSSKVEKKISTSIENLPADLKQDYTESFKKIKLEIKAQNDDLVQQLSQKIAYNPNQLDNYLDYSLKAIKNEQKALHLKFIERLQFIYTEKSRSTSSIAEKITFINDYFLKIYERNKHILDNDHDMLKKIKAKFEQELKRISNLTLGQLGNLKKFMENPQKAQQQNINSRQSVIDIFKAHYLVIDLSNQQSEYKTKFIKALEEKLGEVLDNYNLKITNQPQENLSSADILDNQRVKKIQNYIQYLNMAGETIEFIKNQLERLSLIEDRQNIDKEIVNRYLRIEKHSENLRFYEDQINGMLDYANQFEFYNDKKKNMTVKELEADLQIIERNVEILKQRHEFFNKYILIRKPFEFNSISENLLRRFKTLINESKDEIEDTFKDYNNDPASKVNLLMNVFKIMKEKKFKMISKDEVEQNSQELAKLIKNNFEKIRQKCSQKMKIARQKTVEIHKQIKVKEEVKKNEIVIVQNDIQEKIKVTTQEITQRFDEKIQNQTDEDRKKDHEKGKKTQINSFKNDFNKQKDERIRQIEEKFTKIITVLRQSLEQPIKQLAQTLTLYKKAVLDINYDNEKQLAQFEAVLDQIPKAGPKFIKLIEHSLDNNSNDHQSIGRVLLTTNKVFSNFVTSMINNLIKGKDIKYVLENLEKITLTGRDQIAQQQKDTIQKQFGLFKAKYEEYKDYYKNNPNESSISYITTACRDLGIQLRTDFYQNQKPRTGDKIQLLSGIFALWAIQKAQKFEEEVEYTMQPHPTQITTLILLLGMAHDNESLSNRLAQVGTGQGKSIVLAGLSCYLALCGFKVRCACYSAYLSGRDESNFRQLFERLGIQNDIKYGTFNQLCQDILNQGGSNFKGEVEKMILEKPQGWFQKLASKFGTNLVTLNRGANKLKQNPTILLIDEVDVFFDDNFFGSTYCPGIRLRDPTVARFLEYLWTEVVKLGENIEPSTIIASQQFRQLVDRYPSLNKLLENQVHGMIAGALSYKHDYFLIDKKLVYKDNDSISPNISYGYKTVFANIYEHYKGNVSRPNLDEALHISLMAAEFSYAMLPGYFDNILGVTGTLEVLPQYKKKQLKDRYKIEDQYAIPSAFGVNKRRTDHYYIVSQDSFHQTIITKINEVQDRRPIIVFFKTARDLNEFSQSPWYEPYLRRTSNLTEEHEASVRDSRIVRAVNADTITLMTNSFGRGTDFILLDKEIKEKGGLHIIHAFLSHDESEEVQIKGRTARQSNAGSYDCILNENWLEELSLTIGHIPKDATSDAIHNILLKAREEKIDKLSQSTLKLLQQSDNKHNEVVKIFTKQSLAQGDLIDYISKLNIYPEIRKVNIKTVLGLDATGSMSAALRKTCEIIGAAFERAYQVLNDAKVKASIEIKIMVYRNYNSSFDQILETTAYENTPHNLRRFLERVGPKGGWGNEAIEVFFQSLNKEDKIDQVILIGDAAPNTANQVTAKRSNKGENYWNSNGYPATNIEKELQKFLQKKSPVHSFYLNAGAAFNSISQKTTGQSSPFNLSSPKVADELTAFVVENVLKLIQTRVGKSGLNLVQTYRKMFT